jgi:diguanylate cyclase
MTRAGWPVGVIFGSHGRLAPIAAAQAPSGDHDGVTTSTGADRTVTLAPADPESVSDFASAATAVLAYLRRELGFDLALISRRDGEDFLVLRAEDGVFGVTEGAVLPWSDTYCARVADGRAPEVAPDAALVPAHVEASAVLGLDVGAVLSFTMRDADGEVLGSVCAIDGVARGEELAAHGPTLRLMASLLASLLQAERRAQDLERRVERSRDEAERDALTGIGNRRLWDRLVDLEEERCRRYGTTAAVVVVDLDGLKARNDRAGHAAGDALLRAAAAALAADVRDSDVVCRLGGDEFGVLLGDATAAVVP